MVGPRMLCVNGWSLWEGWPRDALRERMEFVGMLNVTVGPWMLCVNGWSLWERYHGWPRDALLERMESVGTLSWLAHGCSA